MRKTQWLACSLAAAVALLAAHLPTAVAAEPAADMKAMSWLAGVWQTPVKDGAQTEYVYVPLFNGEMLSTMMAAKDGQATRYELRVTKVIGAQVVFHEVGFKPDLSLADPVPLRALMSQDKGHIDFQDMKVTATGKDSINVELTLHQPTGTRSVMLSLRRVMKFAPVH